MKKSGKNVENARKKVEARPYKLADAAELIKKTHHTKFNETVELAINLGVDPKHSDQVVRGTVVLPHGLGKAVRVLVIASGEKVREAQESGADFVGGEDMVTKIMGGWTGHDEIRRKTRQSAGPARLDAQPEDRHGHFRCCQSD